MQIATKAMELNEITWGNVIEKKEKREKRRGEKKVQATTLKTGNANLGRGELTCKNNDKMGGGGYEKMFP